MSQPSLSCPAPVPAAIIFLRSNRAWTRADRSRAHARPAASERPFALVTRQGLVDHLRALGNPLLASVSWNRERVPVSEALKRAEQLPSDRRVAVRDDMVFIAER